MNQKARKILKIVTSILFVVVISVYAYSITPKTFQNDTFYTIKIGELIEENVDNPIQLLPWNKGLDMKDHFSFHNLPYTYPHWLYDLLTYQVFKIGNFQGVYYATCVLSIILGLSIYFVNVKLNKSKLLSFIVAIGSIYFLKDFITARAQLVTFILFVLTIYLIEQFIDKPKIRYIVGLIIIPILIANLHCAVWPFYFILYMPYIGEYIVVSILNADYIAIFEKIKLFAKSHCRKNKLSMLQINTEKNRIKRIHENHNKNLEIRRKRAYKIDIEKKKAVKFLIIIGIVAILTGLCTPIKETPYTYLIKTGEGNTTQNINEHLPLTLANNTNMIIIFVSILAILIFSRNKIKLRDLFMLFRTNCFKLYFTKTGVHAGISWKFHVCKNDAWSH